MHLNALLRDREAKAVKDRKGAIVVRRPSGVEYKRYPFDKAPLGAVPVDIALPKSAPRGRWLARLEIDGLDKKEYFAHSGIQSFEGLSARAAKRIQGMSFSPAKGKGKFQTLFVDYLGNIDGPNALPRWFDTEYKILEDIASRLPDPSVSGRIRLYTNLEACPSCRGVMRQFLAAYTNVEMLVLYEWPP